MIFNIGILCNISSQGISDSQWSKSAEKGGECGKHAPRKYISCELDRG